MHRLPLNVGVFLVLQAGYVALLAAVVRAPVSIAVTMLVVGAVLTLPMLPVYLGLVIAQMPDRWSRRRQRLTAIAASPVLLTLFAFVFGVWIAPTGVFLGSIALPGALAFGALVRLPPRQPRSPMT